MPARLRRRKNCLRIETWQQNISFWTQVLILDAKYSEMFAVLAQIVLKKSAEAIGTKRKKVLQGARLISLHIVNH